MPAASQSQLVTIAVGRKAPKRGCRVELLSVSHLETTEVASPASHCCSSAVWPAEDTITQVKRHNTQESARTIVSSSETLYIH